MNILEKDIEDLLFKQLELKQYKFLDERGLHIYHGDKWYRQLRIGDYGIADIVGFSSINHRSYSNKRELKIYIIELKRDFIDINTVTQALRYRKGISDLILNNFNLSNTNVSFSIYLIGKNLSLDDDLYVIQQVPELEIYTYDLDFKYGLTFNHLNPDDFELVNKGSFSKLNILINDYLINYRNED